METINNVQTQLDYSLVGNRFSVIKGVVTCKIVNWILAHTYVKLFIRIGDRPYVVVRITPQPKGKIRVALVDTNSVVIDWYAQFQFYLSGNINEFEQGLKEGSYFPVEQDTGPVDRPI